MSMGNNGKPEKPGKLPKQKKGSKGLRTPAVDRADRTNGVAPARVEDGAGPPRRDVPVLIYVPGLGVDSKNTADHLAEVLSKVADRLDPTTTYSTRAEPATPTPNGLKPSKAVFDGDGRARLQLFELDYKSTLNPSAGPGTPSVVPGAVRASTYAILGLLAFVKATRRPAKTARAKWQLLAGLLALFALVFWAAMTIYAVLLALDLDLPGQGVLGETPAAWTFGISSLGLTVTWATVRKRILGMAGLVQSLMSFVRNDDHLADSITVQLDAAIDGLGAEGWTGDVHLLGYSFGSLVCFEAVNPRTTSLLSPNPLQRVASLTTVGCPLDLVRLYAPNYERGRSERAERLPWTNIFNVADIFASNLIDGDDRATGGSTMHMGSLKATSVRYSDETLAFSRLFLTGRIHSSYWRAAHLANCLDQSATGWILTHPAPTSEALPQEQQPVPV